MFDLEATAKLLQFNNMALSVIVESRYSLVGELNDRVTVFEDDRVVVKASLRQIHKDIRDDPPGHAKVVEDPKVAKGGDIYLGFAFRNALLPPPVLSYVADSFAARPSYPLPFFFSF